MRLAGLCFVMGVLCGLLTAARPQLLYFSLLLVPCCRHWRALAWPCLSLAIGCAWALWAVARAERELLPTVREDQAVVIGARVTGFPMPADDGVVLDDAAPRAAIRRAISAPPR